MSMVRWLNRQQEVIGMERGTSNRGFPLASKACSPRRFARWQPPMGRSRRSVAVTLLVLFSLGLGACSAPGPQTPPFLSPTFRTQFAYVLAGDDGSPSVAGDVVEVRESGSGAKAVTIARAAKQETPSGGETTLRPPDEREGRGASADRDAMRPFLRLSQEANWPSLQRISDPRTIRRDPFNRPYYADYYQYALGIGPEEAASARNEILHDIIALMDESYRRYEMDLRGDRDVKDVLVRTTALGLTGTAAVMDAGSTGRILSAIASGLIGTNAIVDEELFLNYSTQLIQMQMQLDRANVRKVIEMGMTLSVRQYPLESSLRDLVDYFHAGTVTNALHQLVVRKGSELRLAQDDTVRIESARAMERTMTERRLAEEQLETLKVARRLREEARRDGEDAGSSREDRPVEGPDATPPTDRPTPPAVGAPAVDRARPPAGPPPEEPTRPSGRDGSTE